MMMFDVLASVEVKCRGVTLTNLGTSAHRIRGFESTQAPPEKTRWAARGNSPRKIQLAGKGG